MYLSLFQGERERPWVFGLGGGLVSVGEMLLWLK